MKAPREQRASGRNVNRDRPASDPSSFSCTANSQGSIPNLWQPFPPIPLTYNLPLPLNPNPLSLAHPIVPGSYIRIPPRVYSIRRHICIALFFQNRDACHQLEARQLIRKKFVTFTENENKHFLLSNV